MAKANRTRTEKGRENKHVTQTDCNGFCEEVDHLCRECVDWGDLQRQAAHSNPDEDTSGEAENEHLPDHKGDEK